MNTDTHHRSSITDPAKMTADERHDYVETFPDVEDAFDCVHRHKECAIHRGGPCVDEVLAYMAKHDELG